MSDPLSRELEATVRDMFSTGDASKKPSTNGDSDTRNGIDTSRFLPLSPVAIVVYVLLRLTPSMQSPPAMLAPVVAHPVTVWVLGHPATVIAALALLAVIDAMRWSAHRYRVALRRIVHQTTAQQLKSVWVPWWVRPGRLVTARMRLIRGSVIDDTRMDKLTVAIDKAYGSASWRYTLRHHNDRVYLTRTRILPDTRTERHRNLQAALDANSILPDASVTARADNDGAFRIAFSPSLKTGNKAYRDTVADALMTLAGDHESGHVWDVVWRVDARYVDLLLKEPLPTRVNHPILKHVEDIVGGQRLHVPYATGEAGKVGVWNISTSSSAPHFIVIGPTGGGKTTLILSVITELVRRDIPVIGVDPKKIELDGIHDHPGVAAVIIEPLRAAMLVRALVTEMYARLDYVRIQKIDAKDLPLIAVVLDEFFILSAAWQRLMKSGSKEISELLKELDPLGAIADLGALSRSSGIRLLVGVQRPDAQIFGSNSGSVRDNFKTRASLAALSQDGAMMMWGDAQVGRNVDASIPGRATVTQLDGTPMDAQVWLTPNLDRHPNKWDRMSAADRTLITDLTPPVGPAVTCYSAELAALLHDEQQRSLLVETVAEPTLIGGRSLDATPDDLADAVPASQLSEGTRILVDSDGQLVEATALTVAVTITDHSAQTGFVDVHAELVGSRQIVAERYSLTEPVFLAAADALIPA